MADDIIGPFNDKKKSRLWHRLGHDLSVGVAASAITLMVLMVALAVLTADPQHLLYKVFENQASKDNTNKVVAELCNKYPTNLTKAKCVIEFFDDNYQYKMHNGTYRSATEFIEKGGVCRDFAINVCAVLNTMKINCEYVFAPHHVFPKFDIDEGYCIFDTLWWCNNV